MFEGAQVTLNSVPSERAQYAFLSGHTARTARMVNADALLFKPCLKERYTSGFEVFPQTIIRRLKVLIGGSGGW